MGIILNVIIFSMTVTVSLLSVNGNTTPYRDKGLPPKAGVIGGAVGGVAVLLILVVVLILFRHRIKACCAARQSSEQKMHDGDNAEANHGDHHYEDIHALNHQASSGNAVPSVYDNGNLPADSLHYASVEFAKDSTDGRGLPDTNNKNGSSAQDHSSISRTEGATHPEQTLYSTVTKPGEP